MVRKGLKIGKVHGTIERVSGTHHTLCMHHTGQCQSGCVMEFMVLKDFTVKKEFSLKTDHSSIEKEQAEFTICGACIIWDIDEVHPSQNQWSERPIYVIFDQFEHF